MDIDYKIPKSILTPTGGFLSGYRYSLNPYAGCSYGCSFCYVRQSPVGLFRKQEWGTWVDVKRNVKETFFKEMKNARKNRDVTIFMSSSTDPYQPLEYREEVTRSLLEAMTEMPPDFLFVQTRGPLVTRDLDVFLKMKDRIRISITVETDLERVRKRFTPFAPPIEARLKAVQTLRDAKVPVQIAVAPILPFSSAFPKTLADIVDRICIDDYFTGDGSQGKRTERLRIENLYEEAERDRWFGPETHKQAYERFVKTFSPEQVLISQDGFMPY